MIAVVLLMAFWLGRFESRSRLAAMVRNLYPMALFGVLYGQTGEMNRLVFAEFLDPQFHRVEGAVFGLQPAVNSPAGSPGHGSPSTCTWRTSPTTLCSSGWACFLFLRRPQRAFADYMFALCNTFYVCYLAYVLLPVRGAASYGLGDAPGAGPFSAVMAFVYRHFETEGAAFPSSHVGDRGAGALLHLPVRSAGGLDRRTPGGQPPGGDRLLPLSLRGGRVGRVGDRGDPHPSLAEDQP